MSLSRQEIERAKFTFSIYDFEGNERIDATQLGNALRAMGLCPSLRKISNLGGTRTRHEKMLSVEEFLAIYQQAKNEKEEQGTLEDYLECLSSHDKDKSGKLSVGTLSGLLQGYGEEKLDRDEAEEVINDCGQPYEGEVDYRDFIKNLMKGPDIRIPAALLIQQARANQDMDLGDLDPDANPEANPEAAAEGNSTRTLENINQRGRDKNIRRRTEEQVDGKAILTQGDGENVAEGIPRTRDSVKSNANAENGDRDHHEISRKGSSTKERSEGKSISRRNSKKPGESRRGTSPDISCASDASAEKISHSKRGSATSRAEKLQNPNDDSGDANVCASGKPSRKSSKTKRDSVKSNPSSGRGPEYEEREASPDDVTIASEITAAGGKSISRTRDSQKSDKLERGASPDVSWASETSGAAGTDIPKGSRSSLKAKHGEEHSGGKISPDISCASESVEEHSKSRASLKSKSSGAAESKSSTKSSKKSDSKKKEEEVKAKFQQPLISLKTDGLFGKKKE